MFLRGDTWHYDFIVNGERYRGTTGFKKNEKSKALEVESKLKVQAREKTSIELIWEQTKRKLMNNRTLNISESEIWNAFTKKSTEKIGQSRIHLYKRSIAAFCSWMRENHPEIKNISAVMPSHAAEWVNSIWKMNRATDTKNSIVKVLKRLFKLLGKEYGIVENPFADIKLLKKDSATRDAFSFDEANLILDKAQGWMYSLCLTAMSTGLREGDICLLKKKDVDLVAGWITTKTNKTGANIEIPIFPKLKKHLEEIYKTNQNSEYVFPELVDRYNRRVISRDVKKFFSEIGIKGIYEKIDGYKNRVSKKDIHSYRHTFAFFAAKYGIPLPIVQDILGHSNSEMTRHYMDHAKREDKLEFFQKLPDFISDLKAVRPLNQRIQRIIRKITPENLERNRERFEKLLITC